ncbi:cytochrome c3 family protein [bacterium]|nr:cytochrome c3 family protein [bacterium]
MKMTGLILRSGTLALMLGLLVLFTAGCGSETNPDYVEPDGDYHAFGDLENHGSYLVENEYDFSECVTCHGTTANGVTRLNGQASGVNGTSVRSCYRCHNGESHQVLFTTAMEHTQTVRESGWSFEECIVCHSTTPVTGGVSFGGSCSSTECHAGDAGGPNSCNTCHGDFMADPTDQAGWAPPEGIWAEGVNDPGIGVHQAHLNPQSGWFEPVACATCHIVPSSLGSNGHIDSETPNSAEVILRGLARNGSGFAQYNEANATCSSVYCHGDATPVWTDHSGASRACGSCHGIPPAAPHPQGGSCADCHSEVIDASMTIIAPALHMNGEVDVQIP